VIFVKHILNVDGVKLLIDVYLEMMNMQVVRFLALMDGFMVKDLVITILWVNLIM